MNKNDTIKLTPLLVIRVYHRKVKSPLISFSFSKSLSLSLGFRCIDIMQLFFSFKVTQEQKDSKPIINPNNLTMLGYDI